jgi:hypothetical protein
MEGEKMRLYGRLLIALMLALVALIPLCMSASLNDGPNIKVEGTDSLQGVATMTDTIFAATGTIQTAVDNANPGDTILLWPKTYYGITDVYKDLKIRGSGALWTIADGQKKGSVFTIEPGVTAALSGLTIQNGHAYSGGGIYNMGTLTVSNCNIRRNIADYDGGAVYNDFDAALTLDSCNIYENTGTDGGFLHNEEDALIRNCDIYRNTADDAGGAIFGCCGRFTIENSKVYSNTAVYNGGGIYSESPSVANVVGCTIYGNNAVHGGGVYNTNEMTIANSNIYDNNAEYGGGIYNDYDMAITNSNIYRNRADYGGGIYYNGNYGGTLSITGTLFKPTKITGNTALVDGGGIYWEGTEPVITGSTIIFGNFPNNIAHA